ncbi:MAG: aminoacyl-tRNA hydrolase [Blastocatellia bacterium]|nr:aminoacyl-tRNA hydrolase [Blastocatellia bacterium]
MRLIVGLGNPGPQYEWTRHNCGFMLIDELARRAGRPVRTAECQSLTGRATIGSEEALLVKPQTFMNLSGVAVAALKEKHQSESLLILSDDIALPFGKIRIRREGSAGGHNGLKSIIAKLGTQSFPRLRMGIAPDHPLAAARDFVLGEFPRKDRDALAEMLARAADAVEAILTTGIAEAMSKYN